ncbi:MAG: hypothetical protein COC17_07755 [Hyphomicrobiales bacterium]|nr:DUF4167 domain-containing protein [Hyphomicrobiales bacterium]PCH49726.1 MAG: hypothetical protein COC17_07755 [Hyphomicrobiales bacterium]
MRQPQRNNNNNNRSRGRGRNHNNNNNNNKSSNPLTRNYESNGPEVKIRGNAAHVAEKYSSLARDALTSDDRVMAENYFQHAEHYSRLVAVATAAQEEKRAQQEAQRAERHTENTERQAQQAENIETQQAENNEASEVNVEKSESAEVSIETAEVTEQPRTNSRPRTQRTRRPRKEPKAAVKTDVEAEPKAETTKAAASKSDEKISEDAAGLPEGLLSAGSASRETAGADE